MHLGHSMVIEQVKWFQQLGGDVTIAVAPVVCPVIVCPMSSVGLPLITLTLINFLVVHLPSETRIIFSVGYDILGSSFRRSLKNNSCPFLVPFAR